MSGDRKPVAQLPTREEFARAYILQEREERRQEANGNPPVGYKIACTNGTAQRNVGVEAPCYARIFQSSELVSPAIVRVRPGWPCGVECELGIIFAHDLLPEAPVAPAIGALCVAMEIVEDRYDGISTAGGARLVADGFAHRAFILGDFYGYRLQALDRFSAEIRLNGQTAHRALSNTVLGDPIHAIAWLNSALGERGRMIRAGDIVLSGSITPPLWIGNLPAEVECLIDGFGSLTARFEVGEASDR